MQLTASQSKNFKDIIYDAVVYLYISSRVLSSSGARSLARKSKWLSWMHHYYWNSQTSENQCYNAIPIPKKMRTKQNYVEHKQITHRWSSRELNFHFLKLRCSNVRRTNEKKIPKKKKKKATKANEQEENKNKNFIRKVKNAELKPVYT